MSRRYQPTPNSVTTISIVLPALVAGLLVALTHVPLGIEVLRRGIVFIDLAVAQTAALGTILAAWLDARLHADAHAHSADVHAHSTVEPTTLAAYATAIACASGLHLMRHAPARIQEAVIGCTFVLAASASVLLLSNHPQGGEHLKDVLVGQILWVRWDDLYVAAAISVLVALGLVLLKKKQNRFIFYPTFAVAITLATQLVGVYLVFATLIIPALVAYRRRRPLVLAYLTATGGYVVGLTISVAVDSPSGAVVVLALALVGAIVRAGSRLMNDNATGHQNV